jgi:periplasmic protein TonB
VPLLSLNQFSRPRLLNFSILGDIKRCHSSITYSEITPDYPEIAKQNNWEGRVVILVHISDTGAVESAEITRSSGHPELDEAAIAAVKASHFEPAHRGNEGIPGTVRVPITFSLQ